MKKTTLSLFLFFSIYHLNGQGIENLKATINDPQKKVQAIHHYPKNIKDGECHHVEIISIVVSGTTVTIVEQWSNWIGANAKTTLTGEISNNVATGEWKSSYSKGKWSYNFSTGTGTWNKSNSRFDSFDSWQKLEFVTVGNAAIKDGFYKCP